MAKMYPRAFGGGPSSEQKVWNALSRLDDDWRILHSVGWQALRGKRQGDGEADFVAVHPRCGILLLEVKGGEIIVDAGSWLSRDRFGTLHQIKDPFAQAVRSKYALKDYLALRDRELINVPLIHAVALPDVALDGDLGPSGRRELVLDGGDLASVADALDRIIRHWKPEPRLTPRQVKGVVDLLAPTIEVRSRLRNEIAEISEQQLRLTDQQIHILSGLRRHRRAAVYGSAGTGKTILSVERARRMRDEGLRVLWTCFNQPLAEHVQMSLADEPGIQAAHFHSLVAEQARTAGVRFPLDPDTEWWERDSAQVLLDAAESTGFRYDALIIDEAQDFSNEMITALLMLLQDPDDGAVYAFADSHQSIYRQGWALPEEWFSFELTINCRNTVQIANKVAAVFGDGRDTLGTVGPEPRFESADSEADAISATQRVIDELIEEEMIQPGQVIVLCARRRFLDSLRAAGFAAPKPTQQRVIGVSAETIHRFKGLEADVTVLILHGLELSDALDRSLAYVGMSRARGLLHVIGPRGSKAALGW
jgi:hypothetical protein